MAVNKYVNKYFRLRLIFTIIFLQLEIIYFLCPYLSLQMNVHIGLDVWVTYNFRSIFRYILIFRTEQ